ncbi:MAG: diaminopimelate epimerase [Lachnospiraceae bacterium]|nr:diaminopimelate epimerase [Lachnospiraceae bacterium]
MRFTKMQGCGNDYIYIDGAKEKVRDKAALVRCLSDRHFGIGGDGVIFINPSERADFEMEMYNANGSRSEMCGNGIRCVAKYVYDKGLTDKNPVTIESGGSIKTLYLNLKDGKVDTVTVNMGEPILEAERIPVDVKGFADEGEGVLNRSISIEIGGKKTEASVSCVSMGNPHAVVYVNNVDALDLEKIGPAHEHHPAFPRAVNTEFIQLVDSTHIRMRVWERGTGETLACGTGACASVVASVLNGKTERKVEVKLRGGKLQIEWKEEDNCVYMTGPARVVFEGEVIPSMLS